MVTETIAPQTADEPTNQPAIEPPTPIIHSVTGALDLLGCYAERLQALLDSNIDDFNALVLESEQMPVGLKSRAYSIWMIFVIADEKLTEIHQIIDAINDKAHAEKREAN